MNSILINLHASQEYLQNLIYRTIPISQFMGITVGEYTGNSLVLTAPLQQNINDKGTAFGGSLSILLTLAGWGLVTLKAQAENFDCDIVIHRGAIHYQHPVDGELVASCSVDAQRWDAFSMTYRKKFKSRIEITGSILYKGVEAVVSQNKFVAYKK